MGFRKGEGPFPCGDTGWQVPSPPSEPPGPRCPAPLRQGAPPNPCLMAPVLFHPPELEVKAVCGPVSPVLPIVPGPMAESPP